LSRAIAQRGRYPALDATQSISRLASAIVSDQDRRLITEAMKLLAVYESSRDLIEVGAYRAGSDATVDRAIELVPQIEQFMAQRPDEVEPRAAALERLRKILQVKGRQA
jgi:flagellum-specific ATP synthase